MSLPLYEEYMDSGVAIFGDVPSHWAVSRLKHFGRLITGITPPSEDLNNYSESGWPWVRPEDLDDSGSPVTASKFLTDKGWSYCRSVAPESILVCCIGSIGKLAYTKIETCTNQQITAVEPYSNARYLFYLISALKSELDLRATGNVLRILNSERLGQVPATKPPGQEASQIARFLDHETAKIDALIREQERLIDLLQEKRQAVISNAMTKGLDPDVPMKDSGVEWLGDVPEHWRVGKLRWYATIQGGIAKGKDYADKETISVPYLRVANVQSGFVDLKEVKEIAVLESEIERYTLKYGDVLMNEGGDNDKLGRGTVWKSEIDPCLHQNHVFAIRPNGHLSPEWLAMFTQSYRARYYFYLNSKQSTNLASISSSNVMNLDLPMPPNSEQTEILSYLANEIERFGNLQTQAERGVSILRERRFALISAAVTGKIDVRDWRPSADESAFDEEVRQAGLEATV